MKKVSVLCMAVSVLVGGCNADMPEAHQPSSPASSPMSEYRDWAKAQEDNRQASLAEQAEWRRQKAKADAEAAAFAKAQAKSEAEAKVVRDAAQQDVVDAISKSKADDWEPQRLQCVAAAKRACKFVKQPDRCEWNRMCGPRGCSEAYYHCESTPSKFTCSPGFPWFSKVVVRERGPKTDPKTGFMEADVTRSPDDNEVDCQDI